MSDSSSKQVDKTAVGEIYVCEWGIEPIKEVSLEKGDMMLPAKLVTDLARTNEELYLICADLEFAMNCFKSAEGLGVPDMRNLQSRAFIIAGIIAYARCFKSGVRNIKLDHRKIQLEVEGADNDVHEYLIALRDKHVAHSVNEFELCQSVAIIVQRPDGSQYDGTSVGVIMQQMVGLSAQRLEGAIAHIATLRDHVISELKATRVLLYEEFKEALDSGQQFEVAPTSRGIDRSNVTKSRKKTKGR